MMILIPPRPCPLRRPLAAVVGLVLALPPTAASAAGGEAFVTPQTSVRLVSAWAVAPADGDPRLGLAFTLAPGWHVYWKNPGDAGYAPGFEPVADSDLTAAELRFPAPERFDLAGGLVAIGYEHAVVYPLDVTLKETAAGHARLAGELAFLVCAENCIPYETTLALDLPLGEPREDPARAAELGRWRAALPVPPPEPGAVETRLVDDGDGGIALRWTLHEPGIASPAPDLFFEEQNRVAFERPRFRATAAGPGFEVPIRQLDDTHPLSGPLHVAWTATGFARDGAPLALEGVADLLPPGHGGSARPLARIVLALFTLAIVVGLLVRARRGRSSIPEPMEAPR